MNFRRLAFPLLGVLATVWLAQAQTPAPESKAEGARSLKVKVNYSGVGTVDEKHKIMVFIFDSPEFTQGSVAPSGVEMTTEKDGTVTFADVPASPIYVAAIFDPAGNYDGQSAPPSGSSTGMYTKTPPKPEPVELEKGKPVQIELPFDDRFKMP